MKKRTATEKPENEIAPEAADGAGNESSKKDFICVGIGASAGGVRALQDFFAAMPANSGMAFVVILHLAPDQESSLAEILQAKTRMPVVKVTATHRVEPDHVYVIPPNTQLEMIDGVVRPRALPDERGTRAAIDTFFRTLAEAYESNAVSIVLSGTGADGTQGLKRVKEANGFAVVQNPAEAEFDEMPRNAIATELVDWILPVKQMPEKLVNYKESSERLHLTGEADAKKVAEEINAEESLREILTVLRVRTGHDFSNYKTPTLVRRIARHLQIHELEDIPTYLQFLRDHPDEIQSLQRNLLINVTNFFRDKEAFAALEKTVVPNLFAKKSGRDAVRVWCAGCASGEEAYSLAILLHEFAQNLSDPPKIQVFATDVDDEAILEAREGNYLNTIESDVSEERLKRFFNKEGNRYRVKKELRESVLFAPHNVLRDPPFSKLDLITCRNLLIYINRDTQDRVIEIFHFALVQNGYLFLGSSETAEGLPELFAVVDKKQRIYRRRAAPRGHSGAPPQMPIVGKWQLKIPDRKDAQTRSKAFALGETHYKLLENLAPPSVLVNQEFEVLYMSESIGRYLHFAGGEPSNNLLKLVNPDLLPDLRAALFTAQHNHESSELPNVRVRLDAEETFVNLIVRPIDAESGARELLLVIFDEAGKNPKRIFAQKNDGGDGGVEAQPARVTNKEDAMETVVRRLEEDLMRTRQHLRATIEQHEVSIEELKASNEELQAINEELRSAGEELETSKEELQSVNEELVTVNHELKEKIDEVTRANSDLQNLMSATDIATIFLDRHLRIKRYTPPVEELFNITRTDIGRPLEHFTHRLNYENVAADAEQVLRRLAPVEREIADSNARYFLARFVPYRTLDDRIDGVVLNFIDITERKRAEELLGESQEKFSAFVNASADTVYEMSADWREMLSLNGKKFVATTDSPRADWTERYIPEAEKPRVWAAISRAVETKSTFELEHQVIRLDGSTGWTFSRAIPLLNRAGETVKWFGTASDITERRLTEEKLRRAAELDAFRVELNDALRSLSDAVQIQAAVAEIALNRFGADRCYYCEIEDGKAIVRRDASRADLPAVAGEYRLDDFPLFKAMLDDGVPLVVGDARDTDRMDAELKRLCIQMQIIAFINVPVTKNNRCVGNLCITQSAPRDWADEEVKQAQEVAERTWAAVERARAEAELHESRERLRFALEAANVGAWDLDLTTGQATRTFLHDKCFGAAKPFDDWSYDRFLSFVHPDDRAEVARKYGAALAESKEWHFECRVVWADRSVHWLEAHGSVYRTINDKPARMLGIVSDITERKRREQALRESEEKYRALFNSMDEGYVVVEVLADERGAWNDFRLVEVNPAYERQTGLQNVAGRTGIELLGVPNPRWAQIYGQVVETGEAVRFEEFEANLNRTFDLYAFRLGAPGERRVAVLFTDVSARKRAEQELRDFEERFNLAASVSGFGVHDYDAATNRLYWSPQLKAIHGVAPDAEIAFERVTDFIVAEDRARVAAAIRRALDPAGDGSFEQEFRIARAGTNETRWLYNRSQTYFTGENKKRKAARNTGIVIDITERKQAENALRESQERLRLLVESVPDYAIFTTDDNGTITDWNTGATNVFGYTADEAVGKNTAVIFTPEDRRRKADKKERETAVKNGRAADERWHLRKGGARFYASGVLSPLRKGDAGAGFVKIARDLTKQKQAEDDLRRERESLEQRIKERTAELAAANELLQREVVERQSAQDERIELLRQLVTTQEDERKRIARDMHDQLGQELTALRLKLQSLKENCVQQELCAQIEETQQIAARLDADVDFLAWELRPAALDDLGLVAALGDYVEEWSRHFGIAAEFEALGLDKIRLAPPVEINLYRIAQESLNNIYKHAAATRVSVLLERRARHAVLIVEDNGGGFDPEAAAKVRGDDRGMGLTGMRERAALVGGNLEIESAPNSGATVFARVPIAPENNSSGGA